MQKVRQFVPSCQARKEQATIPARDSLFRDNQNRSSNPTSERKGLEINNNMCTDPQEIDNHFCEYSENLTMPLPSSPLSSAESDIPNFEIVFFKL